jgi:tetratricopeptide (TPR) repeat protein
MRGWVGYWVDLIDAICMLGEHEEELAAATRAFELHPDFTPFLYFKGRVLAALGRIEELSAVIDEIVDQNSVWAGGYMSEFAEVLEVHGYADEAQSFLERSIEWFENRPPEEAATLYHRRDLGWTQFDVGHHEEARQTFDALVEQYPDDVPSRGLRGLVAATTGDSTQVMEDLEWLEHPQDPYQRGLNTFWRAVISGALGRLDGAVDLLWQAYDEGWGYSALFSYVSWFAPLRDHPGFQEFVRPKGGS